MKTFMMLAVSLGVAGSAAALAQDPAKGPPDQKPPASLTKALNAAVSLPGQANRPDDPDQGDDNASPRAIEVVCSKDTPAAQRSAICDGPPVSPD